MTGDAVPLVEMEGIEMTILRYQVIETRYGEAVIMDVQVEDNHLKVITSSTRIIRALKSTDEYPVLASFEKADGKWQIK
ncbi:MAG: hypothetical protein ROW48_18285 [Bellilinea sp.]|jgi:hypothetical protein